MRILALSGSRNPQGQTARAINTILAGVSKGGGDSESIFLPLQNLERCRQCNPDGWGPCRDEHYCVIEDDFPSIAEKVESADVLVIATPVYFGDVSEVTKVFFDRLRRCERHTESSRLKGTAVLSIAAAGGGGGGGPTALVSLERYYAVLGWPVFDGMIATRRSREYMLVAARAAGEKMIKHIEQAA
jgi:multimeric flavodoxin WrbA